MKPSHGTWTSGRPGPISTLQSASMRGGGSAEQIAKECLFRPVSIVIAGGREEGAVAALTRLDKGDVRVCDERGPRLGKHHDKGIVERVDDQGGYSEVSREDGAGDAVVVIVGIAEIAVARDDELVEVAHGANFVEFDL